MFAISLHTLGGFKQGKKVILFYRMRNARYEGNLMSELIIRIQARSNLRFTYSPRWDGADLDEVAGEGVGAV